MVITIWTVIRPIATYVRLVNAFDHTDSLVYLCSVISTTEKNAISIVVFFSVTFFTINNYSYDLLLAS